MRKRRKTKYIWLPMLGADPLDGGDLSQTNGFSIQATTDASANVNVAGSMALTPLLEDTPQEEVTTGNPDPNIADFIGTDYLIKRIVGKIFVGVNNVAADTFQTVACTCGLFVARAHDANPLSPIGGTTNTQAVENYGPNYVDNIREPWIWRRTWLLSNALCTNGDAGQAQWERFPSNNASYGSIQDGPHVDAKTGRRVRNDERLWFGMTVCGVTNDSQEYSPKPVQQATVNAYVDLRVLGALRKARNRSNF